MERPESPSEAWEAQKNCSESGHHERQTGGAPQFQYNTMAMVLGEGPESFMLRVDRFGETAGEKNSPWPWLLTKMNMTIISGLSHQCQTERRMLYSDEQLS